MKNAAADDLRHEALQVGRRHVAGEEGRRCGGDARADHLLPRRRRSDQVADGAAAAALGDDRLQRVGLGRGLDHHLAADREADAADPLGVDVGAGLEEGDRGVDVALALPAEQVRVALALALAAAVEEQDAVAVAASIFARFCEDARPGNEITAAPFFDSTYQPSGAARRSS